MEFKGTETPSGMTYTNPAAETTKDESSRPKPNWKKGPHGVGDPEDKTLRKVESEVMIPIKMRDKAKMEKCIPEVQAFSECCKSSSLAMVVTCRTQNFNLKSCLTKWYNDEDFKKLCTEEYLAERSEYRRTGIKRKVKKYEA